MVFDESRDFWEEISFAKVKIGNLEIIPPSYAIFHQTYNTNSHILGDPGKTLARLPFDYLCGYLEGSTLGKSSKTTFLYNGISHKTREDWFPNLEFISLEENELKDLVDKIKLNKPFVDKIKTIR